MLLGLTGLVLAADLGPARRVDIDYDSCTDFGPCEPCPVDLVRRFQLLLALWPLSILPVGQK